MSGKRARLIRQQVYGSMSASSREYKKEGGGIEIRGRKFVRRGNISAGSLRREYQRRKREWKSRRTSG